MSNAARIACAACAAAVLAGCALSDRPHRVPSREAVEPEATGDAATDFEGRPLQIPHDTNPAIVQSEPVELFSTVCPGVRLLRVDRRHTGAPPGAPPLSPRYYGRDDLGRIQSVGDVLACELRTMRWVDLPRPEGINMILWRGPLVFDPDDDCDWREPVHVAPTARGGQRVTLVERCRRRANGPGGERTVVLEVSSDYRLAVR